MRSGGGGISPASILRIVNMRKEKFIFQLECKKRAQSFPQFNGPILNMYQVYLSVGKISDIIQYDPIRSSQ